MISRERLRQADRIAKRTAFYYQYYSPIYRKTKCPCSCYMCGNPRRQWGEKSLDELKALTVEEDMALSGGGMDRS